MANLLHKGSSQSVMITDDVGNALFGVGALPADADAGYAHGCLWIDTGGGGDHQDLYCNISTAASADFNLVTVAS